MLSALACYQVDHETSVVLFEAPFLYGSFDLVTMFWAGYCYLDSAERTEALVRNAMCWLRPGGMLYIEVLLARDLASFNESHFSRMNGFTVTPRTRDYEQWVYDEFGGRHWMTSPPLPFFLNIVTPESEEIEATISAQTKAAVGALTARVALAAGR
jgi:hypothetical protein